MSRDRDEDVPIIEAAGLVLAGAIGALAVVAALLLLAGVL